MENKLEQLFEKLLKLGRKPNGKEYNHVHIEYNRIMSDFGTFYRFCNYVEDGSINRCLNLKLREIVSINSGLWQFVCENGMIPKENHERVYDVSWGEYGVDCKAQIISREPEYRLIETALTDEDKLEQFLLDNIHIDE